MPEHLLPRASHKEIVNKEAFEQLAAEAGLTDEPNNPTEQTVARTPTTLELGTDRAYQRAPMARHWLTRCLAVAAVTLATPLIADLLHPGVGEEHREGTEAHADEEVGHKGSPFFDLQWTLLLLLVLIGLALVFERLREMLEESLGRHAAVVERIWSELAVLGSLSLVSSVLLQGGVLGGVLGRLSSLAYGGHEYEEHLLRLLEAIHLSLLCGLARLAASPPRRLAAARPSTPNPAPCPLPPAPCPCPCPLP